MAQPSIGAIMNPTFPAWIRESRSLYLERGHTESDWQETVMRWRPIVAYMQIGLTPLQYVGFAESSAAALRTLETTRMAA